MRKERYDFVRQDVEAGIDAFVLHPATREEGRVLTCSDDFMTVETSTGETRRWDYHDCEEMSRSKEEFPYR